MPEIYAVAETNHAANYSTSDTWRLVFLMDSRSTYTFTVDTGTDVLTTSSTHPYLAGTRIQFSTTGTLPTSSPQILAATDYLVASSPGSNTLSVTTVGGTAINFSNTGSGTHTITDVALDSKVSAMAQWVRKEVASYDGLSGRLTWPSGSASTDETTGITTITATVAADNSSGTTGITFDKILLIKGGSATRGNTTGTASAFYTYGTSQTIAAGNNVDVTFRIKRDN